MRVLILIITINFLINPLLGQPVGNEWINFNQSYYKLSVVEDGIYRVTYDDLLNAGLPIGSIDPRRLQVFNKGVEQAIRVVGQSDAKLDPGDYIEFYGRQNDGQSDSELYDPPSVQPHQLYSLYTDSSTYFITWLLPGSTFGKRISTFFENNTGGLPEESSQNAEKIQLFTSQYSQGRTINNFTSRTKFTDGEGWTGPKITENSGQPFQDIIINNIFNTVPADGNPTLELLLVGRNTAFDHDYRILAGASVASLREVTTGQFARFETLQINEELLWSDISIAGDVVIRVEIINDGGIQSNISVSLAKITFAGDFNMGGLNSFKINLKANPVNKSFIRVINISPGVEIFDITDPANLTQIGYIDNVSDLTAIVPSTILPRRLLIKSPGFLTAEITKVNFININPLLYDYIIISHSSLRKPSLNYSDPVQAYADYRATTAGGNFSPLVVNMRQLYNQFSYGEKSPLAIYRFIRHLVNNGNPQFLFLIGKGLDVDNNFYRSDQNTFTYKDLVPSAGMPGSDNVFSAGLNGTTFDPAIPTGRIPASTSNHVENYLNKVIEQESIPFNSLWRKNGLHMSGGVSASEISVFRTFLDGYQGISEGDFFGGKITTFQKQTNSVVELINISEVINDGVSLVTFFGHSSPNITDMDIGFVTDPQHGYENKGKYPVFLMNGCNSGAIFINSLIWGEDWILAKDKGAIGYVAHTSFGFSSVLNNYSTEFYNTGFADSIYINKPIGEVLQELIKRFQVSYTPSEVNIAQMQQMVLMGDPAVKIFSAENPDYETNQGQLSASSFNQNPITAQSDSFKIEAIVRNFGKVHPDTIKISVFRRLSDGTSVNYGPFLFRNVLYQDTLSITIDNQLPNSFGNNEFEVRIDPLFEIDELDETNNSAVLNLFIPLNNTFNISPFPFAIINQTQTSLKTQSTNVFSGNKLIDFQIDTLPTFSSPFLMVASLSANILAEWPVSLLNTDSLVYYWRSRFSNPNPNESAEWTASSFSYINNGPEGWAQLDFSQFDNNPLDGLVPDQLSKTWKFQETFLDISLNTYGSLAGAVPDDVDLLFDGTTMIFDGGDPRRLCREDALTMVAFDKSTLIPYAPLPFLFQQPETCGRRPQVLNNFTNTQIFGASDYLTQWVDAVNSGDLVLVFSIGNFQWQSFTPGLLQKLEELGASAATINSLTDGQPYILLGKKGSVPGSEIEITGLQPDFINLGQTLNGIFTSGAIFSPLIGPSVSWNSLLNSINISGSDEYTFDIAGLNTNGTELNLLTDITSSNTDLSTISSSQYRKIRLKSNLQDEVELTTPQLDHWIVSYETVPEGVAFFITNDENGSLQLSKQEGEIFNTQVGFTNVSEKSFQDSIEVEYEIFNLASRTVIKNSLKAPAPVPGDTSVINISIDTRGKVGDNNLRISFNPSLLPEQFYENNVIDIPGYFFVNRDNTNPLIEVSFDGEFIFNGDVVSPSPLISMIMRDENNFLFKEDTLGVNIFLKYPESDSYTRINFTDLELQWFPASQNTDFEVQLKPQSLMDGLYALKVQADDASGNQSGTEPYEITFNVVNESTITNFYPYPNPFSTSTRFIFTLTGSEIPDQIKIQIMTISGKVVREITQDELGQLRIGNNVSDFFWNGRDEFGDQLANGVYLYRVIVRNNGQPLELRQTKGDKAFKKGFGKIYLLK